MSPGADACDPKSILADIAPEVLPICRYLAYNVTETAFQAIYDQHSTRTKSQSALNPFALPQVNQKRGIWREQADAIKLALGPKPTSGFMSLHRQSHYLGLRNLGASCYMNSYLQALYMNPSFRCRLFNLWPSFASEPFASYHSTHFCTLQMRGAESCMS